MKERIFFIVLFLSVTLVAMANGVKIKGIYYILDKNSLEATVTYTGKFSSDTSTYSGDIIIPETIKHGGKTYRVTSLDNCAFYRCKNVTSIIIPDNVSGSRNAGLTSCLPFIGCTKLKQPVCNSTYFVYLPHDYEGSYEIKQGTLKIEKGAFEGCSELTSVIIPNSVKYINDDAFSRISKIKSIFIPESVTYLSDNFRACPELTEIRVDKNNKKYCDVDGVVFSKDMTTLVRYPIGKNLLSYTIPYGAKIIGSYAFSGSELRHIIIPGSVTTIGKSAFQNCDELLSVVIPQGVTTIGYDAFYSCDNLSSVTLPNSLKEIGSDAFRYCKKLSSVIIPSSVTSVGYTAFKDCDALQEIKYPKGLDLSKAAIPSKTKCIAYDPQVISGESSVLPQEEQLPPLLSLVEGSVHFSDATKNNRIDVGEECAVTFKIMNLGKSSATNCEVIVKLSGTASGISVPMLKLPAIAIGETYDVHIPVVSDMNTQDGKVTMSIEVYEPSGWGIAPFDLIIATKAYDPPYLQIVDYKVSSLSGKVHKMEPFTLIYTLQNTKYGDAEDVNVKITIPNNVIMMAGDAEMSFPLVKPGEKKTAQIVLAASNNYDGSNIPISVDVKEKYGKYAESKELNIELQKTASAATEITVKEEKSTYKIVTYKDMALAIAGTPHVALLTNTSVSILRPNWYNKYNNPQNIKSPFPYAVIQLELKGDKEAIDLAKERLSLTMGGKHIVEAKDDKESNTIYFLVHCRNEYIDLDCGDGCEPINIWKERLEPNKVYHGNVTVSVQDK